MEIRGTPGPKPNRWLNRRQVFLDNALPEAEAIHLAVLKGEMPNIQNERWQAAVEVEHQCWGKPKITQEITGAIGLLTRDQLIELETTKQQLLDTLHAKLLPVGENTGEDNEE